MERCVFQGITRVSNGACQRVPDLLTFVCPVKRSRALLASNPTRDNRAEGAPTALPAPGRFACRGQPLSCHWTPELCLEKRTVPLPSRQRHKSDAFHRAEEPRMSRPRSMGIACAGGLRKGSRGMSSRLGLNESVLPANCQASLRALGSRITRKGNQAQGRAYNSLLTITTSSS